MNPFSSHLRRIITIITLVCFSSEAFAIPLIRDAEIEHTLRTYADPIFKAAGVNGAAIRIFIVQDASLNAYVAGGSNMFIHTGLIMATNTPDMLIGVMAHETGHIAGGHLAQGAEKLKGAQMGTILSAVLGAAAAVASRKPEAAAAVIAGSQNAIGRNFLAYTRAHEQAADQSALTTMDKLGISADGLLKMFALLQRNERQHMGNVDPYLLTHPLSADRIEHVRNHVEKSKIPPGTYPEADLILHKRMVAKLFGFIESPERTLQQYSITDKSVPARMARAVAYYKMPDIDRSLSEMDSLLKEFPDDPFFHELKGQILFENNRIKDSLTSYQKAVKLLPNSPLILADLAKVELAQNQPALIPSATEHLEKSVRLDNSNANSWRLLATAYGKAGNNGLSYLSLAEEASLNDNPETTLKQAEYALQNLKPGTPSYLRAQDIKAQALKLKKDKKEEERPF